MKGDEDIVRGANVAPSCCRVVTLLSWRAHKMTSLRVFSAMKEILTVLCEYELKATEEVTSDEKKKTRLKL